LRVTDLRNQLFSPQNSNSFFFGLRVGCILFVQKHISECRSYNDGFAHRLPLGTMNTLLGKKIGMTQVYTEGNELVPVTVIEVGPCPILQVKTRESDGY